MHEYKLEAGLLDIYERARVDGHAPLGVMDRHLPNGFVEQNGRDICVYTESPIVATPFEFVPAIEPGNITMADMEALDTYGVLDAWKEPHRLYHDIQHLETMLRALNEYTANVDPGFTQQDLKYIMYFILYHDAVYDIGRPSGENEELSRDLFRSHHGADDPLYFVDRMIIYTQPKWHHKLPGASGLLKHLSDLCYDLDLYNIGQSHVDFMDATIHVIVEHSSWNNVGPESFKVSYNFLSKLAEDGLFKTDYFREKYEIQALDNIMRLGEYACQ